VNAVDSAPAAASLGDPAPVGRHDHVIICGLGNLGFRIYTQLDEMGIPLVVIDRSPDREFVRRVRAGSDCILIDDARQPEALAAADIATARALITTFDNDLSNLEVALTAARVRPDLRVVMRFFNIDLAPSIQAALPNLVVLSLSALASPAFVTAAIDPHTRHAVFLDDQALSVDEIPVAHAGMLDRLARSRGVVLAAQQGAAPPVLFPPPGHIVAPGDRITIVGPEQDLRSLPRLMGHLVAAPRHRPWHGPRLLLARFTGLLHNLDSALYVTLGVLAASIIVSVGLFALTQGMSPLDALFFVFTVISATGVGGSDVTGYPAELKIYVIGLMVVGTAVLTILYAFVTNYIVSVKLSGLLGQQATLMDNHIVVSGLGTVGYRVVEGLLAQGEQVVVMEQSGTSRFLPLLRGYRRQVHVLIGDARLRDLLDLANVQAARCVVACTSDDMANIQTALNARQVNPGIRVVFRMFDQTTAQQVAATFGFEAALSASSMGAPAFVTAALGQTVALSLAVGEQTLSVVRVVVPPAGSAAPTLGALLEGLTARVLYHLPPGQTPHYRPDPTMPLAPGDALVLIATSDALRQVTTRLGGAAGLGRGAAA
jgi:Trk K+ transport system NAD-binding subunit